MSTIIQTLTNGCRKGVATLVRVGHRNRYLLAVVTASALSTGTLMATAPKHDPRVVEEKAWPVTTVEANPGELSPQLELFGRVETPNHAQLSAALEADVEQIHVIEGQQVQRGELLLSLDDVDERLRLQQAEAQLLEARADLTTLTRELDSDQAVLSHMRELYELTSAKAERLKQLATRNLVATEQLENTLQEVARQGIELSRQQARVDVHPQREARARAALVRAESLVSAQELAVERTRIRAPFNGRIARLSASPGNRVTRGQQLLSLYDTDSLQVRVPVPATSVQALKVAIAEGREVRATVEHRGGRQDVALMQLAGEVDAGRSGVDALFVFDREPTDLELGRAVNLRIDLPAVSDVVALPVQSLYNNSRVYLVSEERLQGIDVIPLGQRTDTDGQLQVLVPAHALPAGSEVLASDVPKASDGLKVSVLREAGTTG